MTLAASTVSQTPEPNIPRISWVPPAGRLRGLSLLNGLLRILTLGVYHFWGKTEVRQRIWSAVRIDGEPLEYRGTGGELLRGFLIVFFLILLPMGLAGFASSLFLPATAQGIYTLVFWGLCSCSPASASTARAAIASRVRAGVASAADCRGARGDSLGPTCGRCCSCL